MELGGGRQGAVAPSLTKSLPKPHRKLDREGAGVVNYNNLTYQNIMFFIPQASIPESDTRSRELQLAFFVALVAENLTYGPYRAAGAAAKQHPQGRQSRYYVREGNL